MNDEIREASSGEQLLPSSIETPVILNPATGALLQELSAIRMLLNEIRGNAERDEVPAPGMFRLPLRTHVRIRSTEVLIFPTVTEATAASESETEQLTIVDNADANTLGVKASYTPPVGSTARITGASFAANSGVPQARLELVRGGVTTIVSAPTTGEAPVLGIVLEDGDSIQWNVTTLGGAASTADFSISAIEITPIAANDPGSFSLRVGTENRITFKPAGDGVLLIPVKATFERGIEVSIVNAAGNAAAVTEILDAFILGYPE